MSKDDVTGIFGAILSSIFASLGFLWNIGALQFIFSFLAGSFTTYVVQHRLQIKSEKRKTKRENALVMRDEIYGPIFMEVSEILKSVESVGYSDWSMGEKLREIMVHYLFFTIRGDLKNKLSELLDRFEKYQNVRRATELTLQGIIRKEAERTHELDIGTNENTPSLGLLVGKIHVATCMHAFYLDIQRHKSS